MTEAAVKKLQSGSFLPATGKVDNTTALATTNQTTTKSLVNHPEIIGTPVGDYLTNLQKTNPSMFYTIVDNMNSGSYITPGMMKAAEESSKVTDRYYNEDRAKATGALQNYLNYAGNDYQTNTNQLQASAIQDVNDLNNKEGISGTWASSARANRMKSLENTYNNKFNALYNTQNYNLSNQLRDQEYEYGSSNTPISNLIKTNASFGNQANFNQSNNNVYNPFNFAGRKLVEQKAGDIARRNSTLSSQFGGIAF